MTYSIKEFGVDTTLEPNEVLAVANDWLKKQSKILGFRLISHTFTISPLSIGTTESAIITIAYQIG